MRKNYFKIALIFGVAICTTFIFCAYAGAIDVVTPTPNANQPNITATIKELSIIPNYAVLEGQAEQMLVEEFDEFAILNNVEWSSSNPDVISCTKSGEIKGLKKGKATITVKAKIGKAEDSIVIYCAKSMSKQTTSLNVGFNWTSKTPFLFNIQHLYLTLNPLLFSHKITVKGRYNDCFYVTYTYNDVEIEGFVWKNFVPQTVGSKEMLRQLSVYNLNVFTGTTSDTKVTTNYKGDVIWTVVPEGIIDFDDKTGTVTAKEPGIATITATAGTSVKICTVYSIYEWPTQWTGMTNRNTYIYKAEYGAYSTDIYKETGKLFTVCGDMGDSWAYGYDEYNNRGFIPISHISTKNTISYYNDLNIGYPIKDTSIKYISSPYSKRSSDLHRGFDITGGGSYIYGEELVSPVNGTVAYTNIYCYNNNKDPSYGYCITIISDGGKTPKTVLKDTVTGKYFAITFMHMSEAPILREGDTVEVGEVVGKIGNTGNVSGSQGVNPIGTHLHFEINNMEALIGSSLRTDFTYNINPIYFYMDKDFDFYTGSSAYQTYGAYWYGPDKKTEE